ncbi:DUF2842 domain-containing protein [Marinivivus vitaminiproducens]|uniref:DUF2842 domain-containing protein n=1 Tax=Marinivivus vitaminiproducens TaxID=3035935 RepID=UPI0027A94F11|nr:DUF2842 domain-containing protein [Geminicoccaceae bacterium SCSIO 64248]
MRPRSLITTFGLIAFMIVYAFAAMLIGIRLPQDGWLGWGLQAIYYVAAGLAWLGPAVWLIRWGSR